MKQFIITEKHLQDMSPHLSEMPHKYAMPIVQILNSLLPLTEKTDDKPDKPVKKSKKD